MRMHDSRAVFISRRNYECKRKLLRCHTFASPVGGSRVLHRKGSNQDCRTDCKADRGRYKLANLLTIRLSITVNSFANKRMVWLRCKTGGDNIGNTGQSGEKANIYSCDTAEYRAFSAGGCLLPCQLRLRGSAKQLCCTE